MNKIIALFIVLLIISCDHSDSVNNQSYELNKKSLIEKEQYNPKTFLSISVRNKKNIVGQTVIKGVIKNNAAFAKYKDISIKLYFYSKTKTLVDTEEETIFEQLFPGDNKQFKTKYFAPKGTDSVYVEIQSAKQGK